MGAKASRLSLSLLLSLGNGWTEELAAVGGEGVVHAAGVVLALGEAGVQGADAGWLGDGCWVTGGLAV